MRRFPSLLCCALATLSSVDAAAGEARVITVDEAVAMAMAQNAALQAARARLDGFWKKAVTRSFDWLEAE